MISFRLEPDEYNWFVTTCEQQGIPSVSALARTAVHKMIESSSAEPTPLSLAEQVRELREQIYLLAGEVDKLANRIDT